MKCPKCGYLGFETVDRCRNCGYDFSLVNVPSAAAELPLNDGRGAGAALADFELARSATSAATRTPPELDLDRLIGGRPEDTATAHTSLADDRPVNLDDPSSAAGPGDPLPLFSDESVGGGARGVAAPRPMGPPLAVRRATPEIPRGRPRAVRPPRRAERSLALEPETTEQRAVTPRAPAPADAFVAPPVLEPASRVSRLAAACIDIALLGSVNAAVLYLTLQIAGLTTADIAVLPPVPMASFLLLLDGGYVAALTAAGGQTIGKMATGIRVIGEDGRAVDAAGALLRAAGSLVTVLTLGLPYLPTLLPGDGRALADRLARTRVVRAH